MHNIDQITSGDIVTLIPEKLPQDCPFKAHTSEGKLIHYRVLVVSWKGSYLLRELQDEDFHPASYGDGEAQPKHWLPADACKLVSPISTEASLEDIEAIMSSSEQAANIIKQLFPKLWQDWRDSKPQYIKEIEPFEVSTNCQELVWIAKGLIPTTVKPDLGPNQCLGLNIDYDWELVKEEGISYIIPTLKKDKERDEEEWDEEDEMMPNWKAELHGGSQRSELSDSYDQFQRSIDEEVDKRKEKGV